jgi:hypothetical protein
VAVGVGLAFVTVGAADGVLTVAGEEQAVIKTKSASIGQHAVNRSLFFIFSPFPKRPKHARFAAVRMRINQQGSVEQFA